MHKSQALKFDGFVHLVHFLLKSLKNADFWKIAKKPKSAFFKLFSIKSCLSVVDKKLSTVPCVSFWANCTKNKICAICLLTSWPICAIIFRPQGAASDNNECASGGQISDNCPMRITERRCL